MIFNMGVAVTGKSWKKAIVELGKLGCAVSQLAASKLFDFASTALAIWNAWLSTCAVLVLAARALDAQARRAIETNLALAHMGRRRGEPPRIPWPHARSHGPCLARIRNLRIGHYRNHRVLVRAIRLVQAIRSWNKKNGSGSVSKVSV
jgi:hypothetical protein